MEVRVFICVEVPQPPRNYVLGTGLIIADNDNSGGDSCNIF